MKELEEFIAVKEDMSSIMFIERRRGRQRCQNMLPLDIICFV